MSTESGEGPRDWRRRRGRAQREGASARDDRTTESSAEAPADSPEEVILSRPLVSVLEPAVDFVGVYGAPMVLAGIVGLVTGIVVVAFVSSMRLYGYIDIAIGGVLIGVVGAVFFSSVLAAFLSRTGRYGVNTLILVGAFTGIVVIVNVISFENTRRMDVTATNQFSLSNRTKSLLGNLDADVRATAFYKDVEDTDDASVAQRRNTVEETLKEFDARSSRFSYRIIDPDLKPEIVSTYFGARPTSFVAEIVVVENRDTGDFDVLQPTDASFTQLEQDLVTSTLVATGEEQKVVYFLSGHGEKSINSGAPDGYNALRNGLEQDNYRVLTLTWDLANSEVVIPEDAALVVIAGPTSELPEAHREALDLYLDGLNRDGTRRREGGSLALLAEPDTPKSFRGFLSQWGVIVGEGYIRDVDRSVPGLPQTLTLTSFNPSAPVEIVTPKGQQLRNVFMPGATALLPVEDEVRTALPLAATSTNSYLIEDPERTDPVTGAGADSDLRGPFVPALLVRTAGKVGAPAPAGQLVESQVSDILVFGDSDFLTNAGYSRGSGADLFLNSTNFMLGDFSLVSIRPKAFVFREFNLDSNEREFVLWSSWLFLPGLMALMAGFVWWVRR